MVDIVTIISMREGKASISFIDVPKHVLNNPTYSTICRLTYLMRSVFDSHTNFKLKLEKDFMNRCNPDEDFDLGFRHETKVTNTSSENKNTPNKISKKEL